MRVEVAAFNSPTQNPAHVSAFGILTKLTVSGTNRMLM